MTEVRELGEEQIKRISMRVRKAVTSGYGARGATFMFTHADVVTTILKETWKGIREELERPTEQTPPQEKE